jgi:hypothetical protein
VLLTIATVGLRSLLKRITGDMKSKQNIATKPNWTKVRVMGYRNWVMIILPVLDDNADVVYQRTQRKMNRTVDTVGKVVRVDGGERGNLRGNGEYRERYRLTKEKENRGDE